MISMDKLLGEDNKTGSNTNIGGKKGRNNKRDKNYRLDWHLLEG